MRVKCLAEERNAQCFQPGLKPGPPALELGALTMGPPGFNFKYQKKNTIGLFYTDKAKDSDFFVLHDVHFLGETRKRQPSYKVS